MASSKQFEAKEVDISAEDYRAYFDSSVYRVWHLNGKERTYRITRVTRLDSEFRGEARKQPLLRLEDSKGNPVPLPLALNKTNAKTVAGLYGNKPAAWVGRLITLYPTTTDVGGRTEDCIRIRNEDPGKRARKGKAPAPSQLLPPPASSGHDREPGDDTEHDSEPPMGALESDPPESDHVQ
jgi:hypothetical protein